MTTQSKSDQLRALREARSARSGTAKGKPRKAVGSKTTDGGARPPSDGGGDKTRSVEVANSEKRTPQGGRSGDGILGKQRRRPEAEGSIAGNQPGPSDQPRPGRPRLEDKDKTLTATKPWEHAGMSRRTWYRRKAERERKT